MATQQSTRATHCTGGLCAWLSSRVVLPASSSIRQPVIHIYASPAGPEEVQGHHPSLSLTMYPKPEDGPATGFPMSGGGGTGGRGPSAYYHAPGAGAATAAFAMQAQAPLAAWSTGLCDCFDDCSNCCVTCLCPCVTFGQIAEIIDRGSTSCGASGALYALIMCLTGCQCVYSCFYRAKMRAHYGLQESPCADCCIHWCCEPCALCQEYRELKKRGFDMNLGWHANMERQGRTPATMPPLMHPGMTR